MSDINPFERRGDKTTSTEIQIPEFLRPHARINTNRDEKEALQKKEQLYKALESIERKDRKPSEDRNKKPLEVPVVAKGFINKPFRLENEKEVEDFLESLELMFGEYKVRVYCLCIAYKNLEKYRENKKPNTLKIAEWYIQKYFSYDENGVTTVPFCLEKREDFELDQKARNMLNYISKIYASNNI